VKKKVGKGNSGCVGAKKRVRKGNSGRGNAKKEVVKENSEVWKEKLGVLNLKK
jgi:hypothetical protein